MAVPFAPETSASQSTSGLTVIFTDISPYGSDNTEGYNKSDFTTNTIQIYDAYDILVVTLNFLLSNTVEIQQTKDTWYKTVRTLTGIAPYSKTEKFSDLKRITTNKLENVISSGCCQGVTNSSNLCKVNTFMQDAVYAAPIGNSVRWQKDIDNANAYLNQILL